MRDIGLSAILVACLVIAAAVAFLLRRARTRRKARRRADPASDYAMRADWQRSIGTVNYSSFAYFDADRDGKYGPGDRPMAGIMVRLHDEDGTFVSSSRTNNGGFANFAMSTTNGKAAIRFPNTYRFSVSVPPGWRSNSANEIQSMLFQRLPGSPAGIVSQQTPKPVGLSPLRSLAGRMAARTSASLSVMRQGQVLETQVLAEASVFRFDLADDADSVTIAGHGLDRRLALSPYPTDLGLLSAEIAGIDRDASVQTISFDDVTPLGFRKIPSGYAGLEWRNLNAMSRDYTKDSEGYVNGNVSGDYVGYTSSGHPAEFSCERPFGFHSVMLTAAWLKSEGETALIESWLREELIASDRVALSALMPLHYAPMLKHVTRVRLSTEHYWQLVVDDLVLAR